MRDDARLPLPVADLSTHGHAIDLVVAAKLRDQPGDALERRVVAVERLCDVRQPQGDRSLVPAGRRDRRGGLRLAGLAFSMRVQVDACGSEAPCRTLDLAMSWGRRAEVLVTVR